MGHVNLIQQARLHCLQKQPLFALHDCPPCWSAAFHREGKLCPPSSKKGEETEKTTPDALTCHKTSLHRLTAHVPEAHTKSQNTQSGPGQTPGPILEDAGVTREPRHCFSAITQLTVNRAAGLAC